MKKFLSLVLALVMTMSLVTVSAGAKDFTDDSEITYQKAVDVISALEVVDGYTDGSFQPTTQLTRGAAAKIICNLILGPTTADALSADAAPFSDVPTTNVFAGYITYCSQQGIINGYSDGTFRPSDSLTGYAFMKMLLGALGYDGEVEGFTGPNWSVQVGKLALGIGLADGNDEFVGTKPVTREEACLYAFNTLEATMVEYDSRTSVSVGGADIVIAGSEAKEMDQGSYKSYTGSNSDDDSTLEFCERYFEDLKKDETNDDFGRPADTWRIKSEEIGTYSNTDDLVATYTAKVTKAALYNAIGKNTYDDLSDDEATLTYYINGARTIVDADDIGDFVDKNSTAKINDDSDTGNGSLTEVYVDDDNNVTVVVIYTYVFQATSDYSSSSDSVKVAAAGDTDITLDSYTLDGDDFDVADVVEDEYLLITATKLSSSNKYEVQTVATAETVSGEVTEYSSQEDVTIDGTTYGYSVTTKSDSVRDEIQSTGGTTALVLDAYGYVIAVDDTAIGGNYVFITAADQTTLGTSVIAYGYFADGTEAEITLKKVGNSTAKNDMDDAFGWYTYTVDSSDRYTLSDVGGSYDAVADDTLNDTGTVIANGRAALPEVESESGIRANEKTIYVIVDDEGDMDVYTGVSNAPDISVTSGTYTIGYVYRTSTDYASYVFVSVEDCVADVDASTDDDTFIFLMELESTKNNGDDTYYVYSAIVDGAETTVSTDSKYAPMRLYSKVKIDSSTDWITSMKEVRASGTSGDYTTDAAYYYATFSDVTVNYSSGVLTFGGYDFVVNSDSYLNLVLDYTEEGSGDTDVRDMMSDSGLDYEPTAGISGSSLKSTLNGYEVSGYFYVITEDDYENGNGNTTVEHLFFYVDSAEATDGSGSGSGGSGDAGEFEYTVSVAKNGKATVNVSDFEWPTNVECNAVTITAELVDEDGTYVDTVEITLNYGETSGRVITDDTGYDNTDTLTIDEDTIDIDYSELTGIAVTTDPTKMEYTAGEEFDATGMVVTATYENEGTKVVTDYQVDKDVLTLDDNGANVTVTFSGETAKTEATLTVNARTSVEVTLTADALDMDATDLDTTITASVSDGATLTSAEVTATSGSDSSYEKIDVRFDTETGVLTIITSGATVDDTYTITVTGTAEDNSTTDTATITVTIVE